MQALAESPYIMLKQPIFFCDQQSFLGGVSKSMLTLNEAIIDVKKG
ncbi:MULTISPECIES: hypothetical protein [unclassified Acinetobacter]|nr:MULTISPECIES: hypothetical protein [unclassified Acinetobacter]